ncbi:MAG: hypothetical protein EHM61_14565 [Acidobacteria bacterium]|nr:MAG: hypothetical protein EHM61_14565 [Acidobacteriota bacterium]
MTPTSIPDADQRRTAVTTPHHAFVWASAGTGKTHTLTLRALYLLLNAPFLPGALEQFPEIGYLYASPDRRVRLKAARAAVRSLVLTTFTRKAAAEMQTRLYGYLDLLASSATRTDLKAALCAGGKHGDPLLEEICDDLCARFGGGADAEAGYTLLRQGAEALGELACELQISTIHSLAASILKRHPLEARIPITARFAEENEDDYGDLDDALIRRWWQTEALSDPDLEEGLDKLLAQVSPYQIREWLKKVYHYPEIAGQLELWTCPDPADVQLALAACADLGKELRGNAGKRIASNGERLLELASALQTREKRAPSWSDLCRFLYENRSNLFLDAVHASKAVKCAIQQLDRHLSAYFESFERIYPVALGMCLLEQLGQEWSIWRRVLARFLAWAKTSGVGALGVVGFDEMIRLAGDLLEQQPKVKHAERGRLRALLVDEFQDTDPDQLRLITALLRKAHSGDHEILGFFVGDRKQSIYRFRGADVDSTTSFSANYRALTDCCLPVENLFLAATFRSLPTVTGLVNRLFSSELPLIRDDQENLSPVRGENGEPPEWVWIQSEDASKPLTAGRARALASAETVRLIDQFVTRPVEENLEAQASVEALVALGPQASPLGSGRKRRAPSPAQMTMFSLWTGGDTPCPSAGETPALPATPPRPGKYSDILVLVRSGRELDALLPTLQEAGIPVVSSGARTLYRQPEVSDILNLLIALHNPLDTVAVGAVLRSPLVQLCDPDIHQLIKTVPPSRLIHEADPLPHFLPEPARMRIESLRRLALLRRSSSVSSWLMEIREFLPLPAYTDSFDLEGRSYARINRLLDAFLAEMKANPTAPLAWLLRQRARASEVGRYDADLGEDVGVSDEGLDAVRVMTIHKAKGLEARYVIVYGWGSVLQETLAASNHRGSIAIRTEPSCASRDSRRVEFSLPWGPVVVTSEHLQAAIREEELHLRAEAIRLAYVATTRARDQLSLICALSRHLQVPAQFQTLPAGPASAWDGALQVRSGAIGTPEVRPRPSAPALPDRETYLAHWRAQYERLKNLPDFPLARPSEAAEQHPQSEIRNPQTAIPNPVIVGQLVHRYLERWLQEDAFEPDKLIALWKRLDRAPENALRSAQGLLELFYCGHLPYRERVRMSRIVARELPFYMAAEGKYWNGVIDLVIEENGEIVGVDYKTSAEKEQLPESYEQQEAVYSEALKRLFPGKTVKFEFWWVCDSTSFYEPDKLTN